MINSDVKKDVLIVHTKHSPELEMSRILFMLDSLEKESLILGFEIKNKSLEDIYIDLLKS